MPLKLIQYLILNVALPVQIYTHACCKHKMGVWRVSAPDWVAANA